MRRACHSSELTNHALISQKQTKFFHPFTVHAKIAMAETRRRAHSDYALNRTQVKLEIVDKTEKRAAAFGVEIIVGLGGDPGSRQISYRCSRRSPAIRGGDSKLKRRNPVCGIRRIARHAIRRRWTRRHA